MKEDESVFDDNDAPRFDDEQFPQEDEELVLDDDLYSEDVDSTFDVMDSDEEFVIADWDEETEDENPEIYAPPFDANGEGDDAAWVEDAVSEMGLNVSGSDDDVTAESAGDSEEFFAGIADPVGVEGLAAGIQGEEEFTPDDVFAAADELLQASVEDDVPAMPFQADEETGEDDEWVEDAQREMQSVYDEDDPLGFNRPAPAPVSFSESAGGDDEHDVLFGEQMDIPENVLGENRQFSEDGDGWGGTNTELDDLGMDMIHVENDTPTYMLDDGAMSDVHEHDDLELIDELEGDFDVLGDDEDFEIETDEAAFAETASEEPVVASAAQADPFASNPFDDEAEAVAETGGGDAFGAESSSFEDPVGFEEDLGFQTGEEDDGVVLFGETSGAPAADPFAQEEDAFGEDQGGFGDQVTFGEAASEEGAEAFDVHRPLAGEFEPIHGAAEEEGVVFDAPAGGDFEAGASEDEEWAPVSSYEEQLDYEDDQENGEGEFDEYGDEEDPDYSEHEEYYEQGDFGEYAEPAARSKRGLILSLAALLLVGASGAFWYFKDEILPRNDEAQVIDVIRVPRPKTGPDGPGATSPGGPKTTDPKSTDPKATDPKATDPKTTDPEVTGPKATDPKVTDPKTTDPKIGDPKVTDPKSTDPKVGDPKTGPETTDPKTTDPKLPIAKIPDPKPGVGEETQPKDPVAKTPDPKPPVAVPDAGPGAAGKEPKVAQKEPTNPVGTPDPKETDPNKLAKGAGGFADPKRMDEGALVPEDMVQVGGEGDGTQVSARDKGIMEKHMRETMSGDIPLVMGAQALAQLYNENIFVGQVKSIKDGLVTLRTGRGEITLYRNRVRALTTLEAAEYEQLKSVAETGLVRLRNNNRLKGKIVEARDDAVVLMVNANRVIIPKSAIESVANDANSAVNLNAGEDIENDDWFRQLVEKRLEERDVKRAESATPGKLPAPGR